ncbi:MAG: DUF4836 family protein [Chitinophagaceae bacterium]|nr:MAG: DUF4836 family protein [Chitinophagaceae bacterium]
MKTKLFLLSILMTVVFAACNSGGKTGLLIPADAGMVMHIDLNALSSKLSWDEIKKANWFAEAQKEAKDSLIKKLLTDPKESGINTSSHIVIFAKTNTDGGGYAVVNTDVSDAKKLSETITSIGKSEIKIEKDGEYNFVNIDNKAVVYFNDKKLVSVTGSANFNGMKNQGNSKEYPIDSLKQYAKTIFALKGKALLDSDERFVKLINDKSDIHYWANAGNMSNGLLTGMAAMMKLDVMLKDAITAASINFDNGKISLTSNQYYGKEMTAFYKKYEGKTISDETLQNLPSGDALFALAAGFNPEGIKEFAKLIGVDGLLNMGLAKANISIDDFVKANKGQLFMALTQLSFGNEKKSVDLGNGEKYEYIDNRPDPKYIVGAQVADKTAFEKMVGAIKSNLLGIDDADTSINKAINQELTDKWFAISNDKTLVDAVINSTNTSAPAYSNYLKGSNMGLYFNIEKIIDNTTKSSKDTAVSEAATLSKNFWRIAHLSGKLKSGVWSSTGEITLADANTNALKQLNKYIDDMVKIGIEENKRRKANNEFSSIPVVVDTATTTSIQP